MDLDLPAIFSIFLLLFIAVHIVRRSKTKHSSSKLPPGPPKLPLIGNTHQLGALPHRTLAELATQYGPLMHIKLGELSTVVASSPEIAKEVMRSHDTIFANRPNLFAAHVMTYGSKGMSFSPYGSYLRQMRKICTLELLTPKRVESFRPVRRQEMSSLVKEISLSERSPTNLSNKIHSLTYGLASRAAFGAKSRDQETFIALMKDVVKVVAGFSAADLFPSIKVLRVLTGLRSRVEKLHQEVDVILENIVREHRQRNLETKGREDEKAAEDLVDVLLKLQKHSNLEHPLSDNIIKATILDIFAAGGGTSSKTIEWAMSEMVRDPRVMDKAQGEVRRTFDAKGYVDEEKVNELRYLKSVIKETLRLHPPVPLLLPRESSERCEINGYEIPAKSKVIVNAWAIGRDPSYWIEAERFYPERFLGSTVDFKGTDFEFIPFGAGRRICPGITFGMTNVELALATLLFHFDWKMPNEVSPQQLDMTESFGLSVRRKTDLILIPIVYQSSTSWGLFGSAKVRG